MPTPPNPLPGPPRGILHRDGAPARFELHRHAPADALADRVECYWVTRWDLRGQHPYAQDVLPHPSIHVVVEPSASGVFGIPTARWTKVLEGRSRAVGIKFHPGAFTACPPAELTDQKLSLAAVFGDPGTSYERAVLATDDDVALVALADEFVGRNCPPVDAEGTQARRVVAGMQECGEMLRVEDVAASHGLSIRALQRLFARRIGVSPKWVLQRYRLHEAVARIEAGERVDFAALASKLGWYDQAHFVREFTRIVGQPPGRYLAALRRR